MTAGVTREWLAQQAAKAGAPVKEGWKDGALTVFVPGAPRHFKGKGNRYTVSKHTKEWRERTAVRLLEHRLPGAHLEPWPWKPEQPKRITFTVYCRNAFDGADNLRLVCSPVKDALGPRGPRKPGMGLIDDDRDSSGHEFHYQQTVTRKAGSVYGIAVRIEMAT